MKPVVFLGSDDAAAACLAVVASADLVEAVVTPPPARRSRGGAPKPTPVAAEAARRGIPVIETDDANAPPSLRALAARAPRLLLVVSFGQILGRAVREVAPFGAINLHYSILPRWRGAAPVQRAILAGDAETGAAVQRVVARLDAGAVLAVERVVILPRDDTPSLRARLTAAGAPLLASTARRILTGESPPESPQDETLVTRAAPVARSEGDLDPAAEDAVTMERKIRAFEPWPRCRVSVVRADGAAETMTLREAFAEEGSAAPGTVSAGAAGIQIGTARGVLRVTRLQRRGGKDLDARAFLNGFRISAGDRVVRASE